MRNAADTPSGALDSQSPNVCISKPDKLIALLARHCSSNYGGREQMAQILHSDCAITGGVALGCCRLDHRA